MTWSYRLIDRGADGFAVVEMFYDRDGTIMGWTEDSVKLSHYATADDLRSDVRTILNDLERPVLVEAELPGWVEDDDD